MRIKPPETYAEWVNVLGMLKDRVDDDAVIDAMNSGTLNWQAGVAERFSNQLVNVINNRMNEANNRFSREMQHSCNEGDYVRAILALRREFALLKKAVDIPAIPEMQRNQYVNLIVHEADEAQKSFEKMASTDRSGKTSYIVKNNRVNNI